MVKNHKRHKHFFLGIFCGLVVLVLFFLAYFVINHYVRAQDDIHPVLETKKSMVKVLPEEFKKQLQTASPSATFRVPILMYHYVEVVQNRQDKMRLELNIPPSIFEQQVKTLA